MTSPGRAGGGLMRVLLALAVLHALGCAAPHPRRDPTGETFPSVRGTSLDGEAFARPEALAGAPAVLLVGFEQDSQFDLDRWILGLVQAGAEVRILEVPTIPGLVPGLFADDIDGGMRRGIPEEDWGSVVTLYDDAPAVARFTGNEDPLPGRILLLDGEGRVVFFHDRGYSASMLLRLLERLAALPG